MADDDKSLPTNKFARAQIVGAAAIGTGVTQLRYAVRGAVRGFGSRDRASVEEQRDEEIAKRVFKAMGQLRGTALKISQMLATEHDLVPENVRRELSRAAYRAPPLNRAVARRIVHAELGAPPERLFAKFETRPFAAASLGQVHRVTTHDGRELALKVQYPGIDEAIASDIVMIRTLFKTLAPMSTKRRELAAAEPMLAEIEVRLHEETDYRREAEASEWFRAALDPERIAIPAVIPEFSTGRVLTTELLDGLHMQEWLATNPDKAEIDRRGQILCELFFDCMFRLRRVHSDPNPGNYMFLADGRIGVLDFGCTDTVSPEVAAFFGVCMRGYMDNDLDAAMAEYQRLGLLPAKISSEARERYHGLMRLSQEWVAESLASPSFDFAKHPDIITKIREAALTLGPAFEGPAPGVLFLTRAFTGLFRMLRVLGAEVRMSHLIPARETFLAMRNQDQDQANAERGGP